MRSVAIIGRDLSLAWPLLESLETAGFRAVIFTSLAAALPPLRERVFALALLDDVTHCREVSALVPLIAFAPAESCTTALESGADDCICRQVPERELIARVRNLLRRADPPAPEQERMAAVVSEMRVRSEDGVHNLTAGEAALLAALLAHAPRPMTILELAHATGSKRGTVQARIKSLRKKLGPHRLVSRGRLGYQLK